MKPEKMVGIAETEYLELRALLDLEDTPGVLVLKVIMWKSCV